MKYLLVFADEATMAATLQPVPQSPYGTVILRGALGRPGKYVDSGQVDADGNTLWTELEAPIPWPGYHAELVTDGPLPEELAGYVSPHEASGG